MQVFGKAKNIQQGTRGLPELAALARTNNELTTKWLNRLRVTANNNESREQHGQL